MKTLSLKLYDTIVKGKKMLSEDSISRISSYVQTQRVDDVCFMNRSGKPDPYYTLFGWMLCIILGIQMDLKKMKAYLDEADTSKMNLVNYAAHLRCRMLLDYATMKGKLSLLFHKFVPAHLSIEDKDRLVPNGDPDSPYSLFIRMMMAEDSGRMASHMKEHLDTLNLYHLKEGGFANSKDATSATLNATNAALCFKGQLTGFKKNEDVDFLKRSQEMTGGFCASKGSLMPDLLTTATSLFTLHCYGEHPLISPLPFVEAHWLDSGGFAATLAENNSDVEYSFYGLLALGTL